MTAPIEADYVVIGCGAAGMAFADALVRHSDATLAIVDRHHRPGGHWNDAYPFVRLHVPSHYYGVASQPLGDRSLHRGGHNDGLLHMASGAEIVAYYDHVMEHVLLASGRVTYLPMSNWDGGDAVTSLLTGECRHITARKRIVDASRQSLREIRGVRCMLSIGYCDYSDDVPWCDDFVFRAECPKADQGHRPFGAGQIDQTRNNCVGTRCAPRER